MHGGHDSAMWIMKLQRQKNNFINHSEKLPLLLALVSLPSGACLLLAWPWALVLVCPHEASQSKAHPGHQLLHLVAAESGS